MVGLCALSVVICYADRSNISTAILPMSEAFGWDKGFQGVVLSSFFLGYALTQILGGQLADRFGGKLVLAGGVSIWSLFTFMLPAAAAAGIAPLLVARVFLGVGEGVAFPSIHTLIARNVPYASQSSAVGVVTAASYVGTAIAFGVSPYIINMYGWPWVFYLFSASALLWLPLWLPIQTRKAPAPLVRNPSDGEDSYEDMDRSMSSMGASSSGNVPILKPQLSKPINPVSLGPAFWALMQRREVWAICIAQYTQSWGFYGLLNWLPTFFSDFYGVQLADLGGYTLLPYAVQGGLGVVSGLLADRLIASGWSVRGVRVVLQVIGMLGPAACLVLAVSPVVGASPAIASSLITVGLGLSALSLGGVSVSHLDIAPKHAGVIFGAGNTAATAAGFISVPVTGYLLQLTGSWPLVFGITVLHYLMGAVFWTMWVGDSVLPEDDLSDEPPRVARKV
jgi:ACS family sodium-dependent inorganic phosphate cotransporter